MALAPGSRLGPYEIVAPLGTGGMGDVFRARDVRLGRDVAIKQIRAGSADDSQLRFWREARAAAAITHPHVCAIFDVGEHEGEPWLARARASRSGWRAGRCRPRKRSSACSRSWTASAPSTRSASCIATSSPRTSF
jgi:serine/threonine protein kinase